MLAETGSGEAAVLCSVSCVLAGLEGARSSLACRRPHLLPPPHGDGFQHMHWGAQTFSPQQLAKGGVCRPSMGTLTWETWAGSGIPPGVHRPCASTAGQPVHTHTSAHAAGLCWELPHRAEAVHPGGGGSEPGRASSGPRRKDPVMARSSLSSPSDPAPRGCSAAQNLLPHPLRPKS